MDKQTPILIDLDQVTKLYEAGLVDKLRNFGVEGELFETWVPDADQAKSIINLIDSAIDLSLKSELHIRVNKEAIDKERLDHILKEFSSDLIYLILDQEECLTLRLSGFAKEWEGLEKDLSIHIIGSEENSMPKESRRISQASRVEMPVSADQESFHMGSLDLYNFVDYSNCEVGELNENHQNLISVKAQEDNCGIGLWIDPQNHMIKHAVPDKNTKKEMLPMLRRFCDLIEGRPIQDASDHGVSRLEFNVRKNKPRPVPGILIPSQVDKRFHQIQSLIRQALGRYRECAKYEDTSNSFDQGASWEWAQKSSVERISAIQGVLIPYLDGLSAPQSAVTVIDIEYDTRILIRLSGPLAGATIDKQVMMMKIEHLLNQYLDPRLEVFLEPVEDQSKLRRLTLEG